MHRKLGEVCLGLSIILVLPFAAHAEWQKIDYTNEALELKCKHRLVQLTNFSTQAQEKFFFPYSKKEIFRFDDGTSSQELEFNVSYFDLSLFDEPDILDLYANNHSPKKFVLKLSTKEPSLRVMIDHYKDITTRSREQKYFDLRNPGLYFLEENCFGIDKAEEYISHTVPTIVGATASSRYSDSFPIEKTYDGNINSYWIGAPAQNTFTITYELNGLYDFNGVDFNMTWWSSSRYIAADYQIQVSEDGENFTTVATSKSYNIAATRSYDLDGAKGKYLKIFITRLHDPAYYPVLKEVSFELD